MRLCVIGGGCEGGLVYQWYRNGFSDSSEWIDCSFFRTQRKRPFSQQTNWLLPKIHQGMEKKNEVNALFCLIDVSYRI